MGIGRTGTTSRNFILEAIAEKAEREKRREDVNKAAEERYARLALEFQEIHARSGTCAIA